MLIDPTIEEQKNDLHHVGDLDLAAPSIRSADFVGSQFVLFLLLFQMGIQLANLLWLKENEFCSKQRCSI
jgi:hypothetical protein